MANRNNLSYKDGNSYYSYNSAAPLDYKMGVLGSYDGLILHPPNSSWKAYPANTQTMSNPMFVQFNSGGPLKNEVVPMNLKTDMFIFANNRASPFCSSNYSTSNGQVCTTKEQQDYIGLYRGNNSRFGFEGNPQV